MKKLLVILVLAFILSIGSASAIGANIKDINGNTVTTVVQKVGEPVEYGIFLDDFKDFDVTYEVAMTSPGLTVELIRPGLEDVPNSLYTDENVLRVTIENTPTVKTGDQFEALIYIHKEGVTTILPFAAAASGTFQAVIPEFPTIALPVAAIIGLAFFMQRRKEE